MSITRTVKVPPTLQHTMFSSSEPIFAIGITTYTSEYDNRDYASLDIIDPPLTTGYHIDEPFAPASEILALSDNDILHYCKAWLSWDGEEETYPDICQRINTLDSNNPQT